ncbi:MAG: TolC family protein [Candidatus Erginobacter occultus]|nr:TolC family protein [Candidatus Erginobacter occultus]
MEGWVAEALENNREVIAARNLWEAAGESPAAARSLPDPMIGVELMRMDTRVDDFDLVKYMASQRVPWFGKLGAASSAAGLRAEAAGFRYLKARRKVRAEVTAAYWNLWAASAAVKTYRKNLELLREFETIARRRYASGEGLLAGLLRAEVETARLANDLITRERELEVAAAAVNRLLSQPESTPRAPPAAPRLPELNWTLEEALAAARLYCCLLVSWQKEMAAAAETVREARLDWAPDFEFWVAAKQDRDGGDLRELDTGVGINIPWIWSGKYRAGERRARAELARAEAMLENEVDMLLLEVREIHTRAETAERTVKLYREVLLPRAGELVASSRAAYESGRTGFLELIESQKVLLDTELEDYRARARLAAEIARLEAEIAPWDESELATGLLD